MLEKLSPEQEAHIPIYVERYLGLGKATTPFTEEVKSKLINEIFPAIYADAGLVMPRRVEFFASPAAMVKAVTKEFGYGISDVISNLCYGSQDAGWVAFYKYFQEQCSIDLKSRFAIADLCGLCSFWLPYDKAIFVSQNLSDLRMENGVLHNTEGLSWSYEDGFCGYTLFGTTVTEEIVMDMLKDTKNGAKRILALTNVEQRLVAIRAYGAHNMLEQLSGKIVDTKQGRRPTFDGGPEYVLHEVMLEGNKEKLLEMANPSEPKRHYEWVIPECQTVSEALAWRAGLQVFTEPVAKS